MFKLSRLIRYLFLLLLTIIVTLTWPSLAMGQFSFFPSSNGGDSSSETPLWDLNRAKPCGKFWCSDVYLYKDDNFGIPELTLAVAPDKNQSSAEVFLTVEQRAALVQRTFDKIAQDIIQFSPSIPVSNDNNNSNNLQFWWFLNEKPLHPWTPKVEVGVENDQTVVYVPAQPQLGLASQALVTVTEIDATANGTTIEELAQRWRNKLKQSYSSFLWGYTLNQSRPTLRLTVSLVIIGITITLLWLLHSVSKPLRQWKYRLKEESQALTRSLAVNAEATANPSQVETSSDSEDLSENTAQERELSEENPDNRRSNPSHSPSLLRRLKNLVKSNPAWDLSRQILRKQVVIEQKRNLGHLISSLIFLGQFFLVLFGLGLVALSFRRTRFLVDFFFREAAWIPIIWLGISLINQILDFIIDAVLNRWATEGQKRNPDSNRYTLRANTYSKAYKSAKSVLLIAIGIYLTILIIGIDPTVLAGAGAIAVVVAFLSRNVLEDMLNGALILWTDRYAIGDVVIVPGIGDGAVEDMNLYTTSLRNLDGQLTVIPNGQISAVKNLSKNWAQVNFTIKVAWDANLHKTMEILQQVLDQLQNDPQWVDKILEKGEVLGIDEVSHEGILIRTVIKTKPLQQWAIGREFRIRLKEAFDMANISLGVPQREISIVQNGTNGNTVNS